MWKIISAIFLVCLAFANSMPQHFPWMNSYLACIARIPAYNYDPIMLERGTYRVETENTEFSSGEILTFYVDGKDPNDKFKGIFISILENGRAVGEWMPEENFVLRSCDGAKNSAMTEMDTTEKRFREHALRWKAPNCNQDMNFEVRATVIRGENEFEREIRMPLKCVQETDDYYYDMYDYGADDSTEDTKTEKTSTEKPEPEKTTQDGYDMSDQKSDPEEIPENKPTPEGKDWGDNYKENAADPEGEPKTPMPEGLPNTAPELAPKQNESGETPTPEWDKQNHFDRDDVAPSPEKAPSNEPENVSMPEGEAAPAPENIAADGPPMNVLFGGNPVPKSDTDKSAEQASRPSPEGRNNANKLTPPMFLLFRNLAPEPTPEDGDKWDGEKDGDHESMSEETAEPTPKQQLPINSAFPAPENAPAPEEHEWNDKDDGYEKKGTGEPAPENGAMSVGGSPENAPTSEEDTWEKKDEDYEKKDDKKGMGEPVPETSAIVLPTNPIFGGTPENTPEPENNWDKASEDYEKKNEEGTGEPAAEPTPEQKPDVNLPEQKEPEYYYYDDLYDYGHDSSEPDDKNDMNVETQEKKPVPETSPVHNTEKREKFAKEGIVDQEEETMKSTPEEGSKMDGTTPTPETSANPEPKLGDDVYDDMSKSTPEPIPENKADYNETAKPMPEETDQTKPYGDNMDNKDNVIQAPVPENRPKPLGLGMIRCKNPMFNVPKGSSTSFERHEYGAWTNDTAGELMWLPHMGKTPSPGTGPNWAFDGQNYLYMEGSRPAKLGDRAILRGPSGLRGCFCIKLACHAMVDPETTIEIEVNGITVNKNRFSHLGWQIMTTSVDNAGESKIKIIATRGPTFRADVAVDDIRVTPGMC